MATLVQIEIHLSRQSKSLLPISLFIHLLILSRYEVSFIQYYLYDI